MKPILHIRGSYCPFCRQASAIMQELFVEHPEYREIPMAILDEVSQRTETEKYDYNLVPCFFIEGERVFEGVPSKAVIQDVFERALHR